MHPLPVKVPVAAKPEDLLRRVLAAGAVSIAVIVLLAGFSVFRIYSGYIIRDAEDTAVSIAETFLQREAATLMHPAPSGVVLRLDAADLASFDARMKASLRPFSVLKIKIYDAQGTIVYSTDPTVVGRKDTANARLANALRGFSDSKLEKKEEVLDFSDERHFAVDVVETYVPIRSGSNVIGSFELYVDVTKMRKELTAIVSASLVAFLAVLLAVAASFYAVIRRSAIDLWQTRMELERVAVIDFLTGVLNRREIFSRLEREMALMLRKREKGEACGPLSILMLDIDNFKMINDTHGHFVGDAVLREVAMRVAGPLRPYDSIGRFGGEEFLVAFPETAPADAAAVGERIRRLVSETRVEIDGDGFLDITVAVGISSTKPEESTYEEALRRADEALLLAKRQGRNRVVVA